MLMLLAMDVNLSREVYVMEESRAWPMEELIMFTFAFGTMSAVGVVLNARLLINLWTSAITQRSLQVDVPRSRRRNPLTISLCFADLLICAISIPVTLVVAVAPPHSWSLTSCKTIFFLQTVPVSCSALSQTIVSLDRYATIEYSRLMLRVHRTPITLCLLVLVWCTSAVVVLPEMLDTPPDPWHRVFVILHLLVIHILPMVVILTSHIVVRAKLTALSLTARARHGDFPLPIPLLRRPAHMIIVAGASHQQVLLDRHKRMTRSEKEIRRQNRDQRLNAEERPTSSLNSRRRLGNCLVISALMFIAVWLPHVAFTIWSELLEDADIDDRFHIYGLMVGYAGSCVNPLVTMSLLNTQPGFSCRMFVAGMCWVGGWTRRRGGSPPASSTNEAALGPFNPRFIRPQAQPRPRPDNPTVNSMQNLY